MATITFEVDDEVLSRAEDWARARRTTVDQVIASTLSQLGSREATAVPGEGHRQILAPLAPDWGSDLSDRERLHDRDHARAEVYARNRARLLDLVDASDGDMGRQSWDRSRLYDR